MKILIMNLRKIIPITLFLFYSASSVSAIFDENNFVPVGDEDLVGNDSIDDELKAIIRRVHRIVREDNRFGSALVISENCDQIVTAKHNSHYGKLAKDKSLIGQRKFSNVHVAIVGGSKYKVTGVPKDSPHWQAGQTGIPENLDDWEEEDEGIVYDLASGVSGLTCGAENPPKIKRHEIKNLVKTRQLRDCRLIGFPTEVVYNAQGQRFRTGDSAIPVTDEDKAKNIKKYHESKRGMASCRIVHMNSDGKVIHNCDSTGGASGGPIVCKVNNIWKHVSTNDGTVCPKDAKGNNVRECATLDGVEFSVKGDDKAFGVSGSFK